MNKLQSLPANFVNDLKLIIIDYMGENKYQLSYKKCIEEYRDRISFIYGNSSIGFKVLSKYNPYKYKCYNRRSACVTPITDINDNIVAELPINYKHQQLFF